MTSSLAFDDVLRLMHKTFKLTGSRFVANKDPKMIPTSPKTDWDFVAKDGSKELKDFLGTMLSAGIEVAILGEDMYPEMSNLRNVQSTVRVYGLFDKRINLIVKTEETYYRYLEVFDEMTPGFYSTYIWKSGPSFKDLPAAVAKEIIRDRLELLMEFV